MKTRFSLKSVVCLVLALIMVFSLAACSKTTDSGSSQSSSSGSSSSGGAAANNSTPSGGSDAPAYELAAIQTQNGYNAGSGVPEGIQEGTVLNVSYLGQDVPGHITWINTQDSCLHINVFEGLFYYYQGDVNDLRGCLVESWEWADDMLSIVMKVREGVLFHDGTVCDAQAIVDSFTMGAAVYNSGYFTKIASMEATGEYELTFTFSDYYPDFMSKFAGTGCPVVSPTAMEKYGADNNAAAIGTGPYYIESYTSGEICTLKANPNYYLEEKMPHSETVNFVVIPNADTQTSAFISGEINYMKTSVLEQVYALQSAGYTDTCFAHPSPVQTWMFNLNMEIFQNERIREALAKLIDWQAIVDLCFDGTNTVSTGLFSTASPLYVDHTDYYYYAPDEALKIFEEENVDPSTLSFEILAATSFVNVATALQAQFAEYGITVTIEETESSATSSRLANFDYQLANTNCAHGECNPFLYFQLNFQAHTVNHCWDCSASDPETFEKCKALYAEAISCKTYDEMLEVGKEIVNVLMEHYLYLGGYQAFEYYVVAPEVKNVVALSAMGYPEFCYSYIEQ